jgi:hypothetical protein
VKTWTIEFVHNPPLNAPTNLAGLHKTPTPKELSFFVSDKEDERYVKDIARALGETGDFGMIRVFKEADKEEVDYT